MFLKVDLGEFNARVNFEAVRLGEKAESLPSVMCVVEPLFFGCAGVLVVELDLIAGGWRGVRLLVLIQELGSRDRLCAGFGLCQRPRQAGFAGLPVSGSLPPCAVARKVLDEVFAGGFELVADEAQPEEPASEGVLRVVG